MPPKQAFSVADFLQRYIVLVLFGIPLVISLAGALGKVLIKAKFSGRDLYVGPDLTLAAMSAAFVNVLDLAREGGSIQDRLTFTIAFGVVTFFMFLVVIVLHQGCEVRENRNVSTWKHILGLGITSNAIGLGLLVLFMYMKMRGIV